MNIPESMGESSCKRTENGDASTEPERPLKKARFAWQVKGRYHLKNEMSECNKQTSLVLSDNDRAGSSSENESDPNDLGGNTEQNLEILGDYLFKQDFNTLDSVITDSDKALLKPSTSLSTDKLAYPKYVSSCDKHNSTNINKSNENDSDHISVPMSMVLSNNYTEDQCIARWQARQMAKGFVDNTINRVLDSWMVAPLPTDMDNNRFLALDVAEFINNLPGDNSIENEGILMAISAHGLQNTSGSSSNNANKDSQNQSCSSNNKDYISPSSSPLHSEDEEIVRYAKNKQKDADDGSPNELERLWSYDEDMKDNVNNSLSTYFHDTSSSSYQYFSENDNQVCNNEYDGDENGSGNDVLNSHYDFLDTAVSFAIQNKGLTSFGADYG